MQAEKRGTPFSSQEDEVSFGSNFTMVTINDRYIYETSGNIPDSLLERMSLINKQRGVIKRVRLLPPPVKDPSTIIESGMFAQSCYLRRVAAVAVLYQSLRTMTRTTVFAFQSRILQ